MRNQIKVTVYQAKDGTRWRMERGGRIIAESGEAYARKDSCTKAATNLCAAIADGNYVFASDK